MKILKIKNQLSISLLILASIALIVSVSAEYVPPGGGGGNEIKPNDCYGISNPDGDLSDILKTDQEYYYVETYGGWCHFWAYFPSYTLQSYLDNVLIIVYNPSGGHSRWYAHAEYSDHTHSTQIDVSNGVNTIPINSNKRVIEVIIWMQGDVPNGAVMNTDKVSIT